MEAKCIVYGMPARALFIREYENKNKNKNNKSIFKSGQWSHLRYVILCHVEIDPASSPHCSSLAADSGSCNN